MRVFLAMALALSVAGAKAQDASTSSDTPAATAPSTPEQMPPQPPQITFQNGKLSIIAENSRLEDVLNAIREKTGADIDVPEGIGDDRVVVRLGPGAARDVLASLFYGMPVNYVIAGSDENPLEVRSVVLTRKTIAPSTPGSSSTTVARAGAYNPMAARAAEAQQVAIQEMLRSQAEAASASGATEAATNSSSSEPGTAQPSQPAPGAQAAATPAAANGAAGGANDAGTQTADAGAGATASGATAADANGKQQRPIDQMSDMMFKMFQERQQMIQQQKNPPKPAEP